MGISNQAMKIIDLSHEVRIGMPTYPGDAPVVVRQERSVVRDGFALTSLAMTSHVGTHVDVPAHLFADAPGLHAMTPEAFVGKAATADCSGAAGRAVTPDDLASLAEVDGLEFVLIRTGWDRHWGSPRYFKGYPPLSIEACRFLASLNLRGVGLDCPSPDPADSTELSAHRELLKGGMVVVENLCNLHALPESGFLFSALPLRIRDGDGSPVRAVGILL